MLLKSISKQKVARLCIYIPLGLERKDGTPDSRSESRQIFAESSSVDDTTVSSPLSYRHRRDWTVNEPARRTNRCGDSPRASLLASRASSFYRIGRPEDEESEREKRESLRRLNGAQSGSGFHGLQTVSFPVFFFFLFFFAPFFILTRRLLRGDSFRGRCRVNDRRGISRAKEAKTRGFH